MKKEDKLKDLEKEREELKNQLAEVNQKISKDFSIKQYDLMDGGLDLLKRLARVDNRIRMIKIAIVEKQVKETRRAVELRVDAEKVTMEINRIREKLGC